MRRRYRQIKTDDGYKLVEITDDASVGSVGLTVSVQRDLNFRSVVDGSVISSHAKLRDHNARNKVVHESEFGTAKERQSFFEHKAKERADLYQGTAHTSYGKKLKQERINDIREAIAKHERS